MFNKKRRKVAEFLWEVTISGNRMFTYIIDIEMFQTSEPTHVKHYEYGHDLGIGKTTRFVSMPLCVINGMFFNSFIKKMQKSSTI